MQLPPYGICLPCERFVRARDGDTVEVCVRRGGMLWAVRMLDCWCSDNRRSPVYHEAKRVAEDEGREAMDEGRLSVFVPVKSLPENLLGGLSFDRVLGHVFVGTDTTLADVLVRRGLAGRTKKEQPE